MLVVKFDIFSGRPNPVWVLDDTTAASILRSLANNPDIVKEVDSGFTGLGFRGITLTGKIAEKYGLPRSFRILGSPSERRGEALEIAGEIVKSVFLPSVQKATEQEGFIAPDADVAGGLSLVSKALQQHLGAQDRRGPGEQD